MITPFTDDREVDYDSLEKVVNHLVNGGADYIVVQGTTGESPTLTSEEKAEVLAFVKKVNNGRKPIVLGIGGNNTAAVARQIKEADFDGVTAILSVSPYYNKPSQDGIYAHYAHLAEVSPVPIIIYNVPGRTGSNILPETIIRLAEDHDRIAAVKEAAGDIEQYMKLIEGRPNGFLVISGDDALVLPAMACGADGVISVVGNAFPDVFGEMVHAAARGEMEKARENHYRLLNIIDNLFVEGNPAGIKALMALMGMGNGQTRLPLVPASDELKNTMQQLMDKAGFSVQA